jgi:hypothetical protein
MTLHRASRFAALFAMLATAALWSGSSAQAQCAHSGGGYYEQCANPYEQIVFVRPDSFTARQPTQTAIAATPAVQVNAEQIQTPPVVAESTSAPAAQESFDASAASASLLGELASLLKARSGDFESLGNFFEFVAGAGSVLGLVMGWVAARRRFTRCDRQQERAVA